MKTSPLAPKNYQVLPALSGVKFSACEAEIRYKNRTDLLLLTFPQNTQAAAVCTRSLTASAPVEWCRKVSSGGAAQALVVNSGNANAFTGKAGQLAVEETAQATAKLLGCSPENIFIASTGVIGEKLPVEKIIAALPNAHKNLAEDDWLSAAQAIMTTDTFPKLATRSAKIGDVIVNINGIAKGSGMIAPDMATMLAFMVTDADLDATILQSLLGRTAMKTFNCITVDSDTSTSDTAILFATATAKHEKISDAGSSLLEDFKRALYELMEDLALQIIRDGEGASKLLTIKISGAEDDEAARNIGLSIANSPLVKTAAAGEDPNWGRIVMAVGKSGEWADRDNLTIHFGDILVASKGETASTYSEKAGADYMKKAELVFAVNVGVGEGAATVWGCDLTNDYIKINADYRS